MSTYSPDSGRTQTMAVVPMAYSDHEMDGDEDITSEYYDVHAQIEANVEQNHNSSEWKVIAPHGTSNRGRASSTSSSSSAASTAVSTNHGGGKHDDDGDDDDDAVMSHDRHVANHKRNGVNKSVHGPSRKAANLLAKVGVSDMIRSGKRCSAVVW